ncbi:fimbrial protein [Burkholderia territorii]|nr:fimbrial protein [Burkholderia territorii]
MIFEGMRMGVGRRIRAIAFMAAAAAIAAVAVSPASAQTHVDAFGQQISVPRNVASGTILARYYISPAQACRGMSKCEMASFFNRIKGDFDYGKTSTIMTNVSGVSTRLLINGQTYEPDIFKAYYPPIKITQPLEVQLVRDDRPMSDGGLAGVNATYSHYFAVVTREPSAPVDKIYIHLKGTIKTIDSTCSVPAQTVTLPSGSVNKFGNVGSTVGAHSFRIRVNNCPKGYNRIGYMLEPRGGAIANSPGVLPLTAGSTASGVKIRIADDNGTPAVFGTSITVDAYNKATGGSYAIPMQASYIKTDATIKPGTVNGAMTVLLDYQ